MKKISISACVLAALTAFTACSTDRDDNPVLSIPATGSFALYAPGMAASNTIDLDNSSSLTFQADQPNYGYTAHITYMMEFAASEDGSTWSSWQATQTSNENPLAITVPTSEIASAVTLGLVELGREEADFPLDAQVKARVHAFLSVLPDTTSIYSTEATFRATTSYVLPPSPLEHLYFIGAANGWNPDNAVTTLFYPEGADVYTFTTCFEGDGNLKIWAEEDLGVWDNAYGCETDGSQDLKGAIVRGSSAGAIKAPTAEFYTFTFDKKHMSYEWVKLDDQAPAEYESISLIGNFNDWAGDVELTQVTPHNWYVQHTFDADDVEFKFRANHAWDVNWGAAWTVSSDVFAAQGVNGGDNIKCAKGTYRFYINDITGKMLVVPVAQ